MLLLSQIIYFQKKLNWNDIYVRIKKRIILTPTHARAHIHNSEFFADYGTQSPLFMFEFDSHQALLCLLLCYELLIATSVILSI